MLYLFLGGKAAWQRPLLLHLLALSRSREKSGGCLPGFTTCDMQVPTNHQEIRPFGTDPGGFFDTRHAK